ncbi:alpha/beta fold hydrolase [Desulfosporosinus shakirovi]|uniref:alpha/beta fold hydrolase n=1 Tax=Desulfosporosinus shakirovi TaxID=2885154 RepID=UPI001E5B7BAA|nr:alpha/beta hydrolase [Desulfosporosinus sp. SRJS8]MCB8818894.1 alpha/beta hydrolase [Desulfosporosinus sp. SRJS8]
MPYIDILGKGTYYIQSCKSQEDLPTVVFVHGAGGTSENWVCQLAGIEGYNLIALDLPGHGRSEGSAIESITGYREFVWGFAQALELRLFYIVGHSMGGAIALDLGLEHSEALIGLIIIGSGARLPVSFSFLELLSMGKHPLQIVKYSYASTISTDILNKATREMKSVPIGVYQADLQACNEFNIMGRIKDIINPTLVICGQDDQMTPPKYSKHLCKELPHSTITLITEAGHMVMLEQPDQVNEAITNFLYSN